MSTTSPDAPDISVYLNGLQPTPRTLASATLTLARIYELGSV
ncbi:hypothetical protein [Streptomyces sp. NPDC005898]